MREARTSHASRALAARIKDWREDGVREAIFAIGGADGHSAAVLARADLTLAFGGATWPRFIGAGDAGGNSFTAPR